MYSETKSDRFLGLQRDSDGFKKISHIGKCCFALDFVLKSEKAENREIAEILLTFENQRLNSGCRTTNLEPI